MVTVFLYHQLYGLYFQLLHHVHSNIGHGIPALGAYQILTLQRMLYHLGGNILREAVQGVFVALVALVLRYNHYILIFCLGICQNLSLVKQKAELFHGFRVCLF